METAEVNDVWSRFWEAYYEDEGHARKVREVATEYPVRRSLEVSYQDLLDHGMVESTLRLDPDRVLGAGVEAFGRFVRGLDLDDAWDREFEAMILHLAAFPSGYRAFDYTNLMEHLNELVQVEVTLTEDPELKSDLMEAAFVCPDGHVTRLHQPGRRRRELRTCPECGLDVYLDEHDSMFAEIQRARGTADGDLEFMMVIGGRRWKRSGMAAGDTFTVNGIPRADFRGDSTHGDSYLDVLFLESTEEEAFFR